jgi:uncharacterized OsmC-like protein
METHDPERLKEAIRAMIEQIRQRPGGTEVTFRTSTERDAGFRCSARARGRHHVIVDESQRMGGTGQGMNPVELLLGAMGTCQEIMYTLYAALLDIPLDRVRIECRGRLDLRGLFGMEEGVPAGLVGVEFDTYLESSAERQRILELVALAERHCPVMDTLSRPVPARGNAFLNGDPLDVPRSAG